MRLGALTTLSFAATSQDPLVEAGAFAVELGGRVLLGDELGVVLVRAPKPFLDESLVLRSIRLGLLGTAATTTATTASRWLFAIALTVAIRGATIRKRHTLLLLGGDDAVDDVCRDDTGDGSLVMDRLNEVAEVQQTVVHVVGVLELALLEETPDASVNDERDECRNSKSLSARSR